MEPVITEPDRFCPPCSVSVTETLSLRRGKFVHEAVKCDDETANLKSASSSMNFGDT